jgi:hypothetical protein
MLEHLRIILHSDPKREKRHGRGCQRKLNRIKTALEVIKKRIEPNFSKSVEGEFERRNLYGKGLA